MRFHAKQPARIFHPTPNITIRDFGDLELDQDEQVTLVFGQGLENDVTAKSWGAYLTNSINVNLRARGIRVALTLSQLDGVNKTFICLVYTPSMDDFMAYLHENDTLLIAWLDDKIAPLHD